MCTYDTITSHTYHFEIQKRDSEESLLTFVNLFPMFFISFLWSVVCKRPVINVTLITFKIPTKKTRPIGYFPIVLMKIFELYTFQLDIDIDYKHLRYVLLLSRVTYVTFFMKLQIIT